MQSVAPHPDAPMSLLAELTHRCPLQCPYCSNPLALEPKSAELSSREWLRVLDEATALGVLQVHFSGGEPMARKDLPDLIQHASRNGLYTNLITSGVLMDAAAAELLAASGLDHAQLSFQDVEEEGAARIGGMRGAQARKIEAARFIVDQGIPLTLNFVVHRQNVDRIPAMFELADSLGARRVEIAHTQYYGWGLKNRAALLPTRAQFAQSVQHVDEARARFRGRIAIDFVTPDYYADEPKPCMGGWGQRFLNITPAGRALPCHAAETIPNVVFPSVRDSGLEEIWNESALFQMFRGTDWMPDPCRSCARKEIDWGGCRCQALALTGTAEATDPVCTRSTGRVIVEQAISGTSGDRNEMTYRKYRNPPDVL